MSILDKASLIQIPSGYKSTKLYSLRPTNGDGDFTFARSSSATRVNAEGLIETMSANVPRLDYSGGASCASLLLEPQRTNNILQSNQLDTTWVLTNTTITGNQSGIFNSTDAWKLVGNGSNNDRINSNSLSSGAYTFSIYAKAGNSKFVAVVLGSGVVYYNLESGSIGSQASVTSASIESVGNEWYRLNMSVASGSGSVQVYIANAVGNVNTSNGDFIYLQHAQAEVGSYPTSIIPTTTATATRTADVCNNAGTAATFNDSEGVLFAEISRQKGSVLTTAWSINNGSLANSVNVYYYSTNVLYFDIFSGVTTVSGSVNIDTYNLNKIALKYKSGDISLYANGLKLITNTNAISLSGLNDLDFNFGAGNQPFYGKCKQLMVFNEALSNEELSDLTGQINTSFVQLADFYNYTIL
jgi:hypothetical protein